jgi:redox-sensitive bicupin YhaK (pirin superfamily)
MNLNKGLIVTTLKSTTMKEPMERRVFLTRLGLGLASVAALPLHSFTQGIKGKDSEETNISPIKAIKALGFMWDTADPFLFCVHHEDHFPKGNAQMGPDATYFKGRHMGDDFIIKDGFRMYHGKTVPGFPGHPHRGFETITVVRKGIVDHSDSMGASGRYGDGDLQWMTAGKGVQHAEMFPLIHADKDNPMELFQIWLNLPKKNKMVEPHFKMFWRETIPNYSFMDAQEKKTNVEIFAGQIDSIKAPTPPPDSWAADPYNEVAIWNIKMEAGAQWTLPKASVGINRTIYLYEGTTATIADKEVQNYHAIEVLPNMDVNIVAGSTDTSILLLQGRPIGETVIQYGPFVMNTKEEINKAFDDYHKTQFGGWPWPKYDQVHDRSLPRFAKHADGTEEIQKS